jgi:hypothetical protein
MLPPCQRGGCACRPVVKREVENGPPSRVEARAENIVRAEWNEKCDGLGCREQSAMRRFSLFSMLGGMQAWFFCRD